ncbi:MAG: arylsulfatase [Flavisolibacter sp.]
MKKVSFLLSVLVFFSSGKKKVPDVPISDPRPNILLIVADDLGYTDLGCFGGDIHTPNLDALAAKGLKFTDFHTAPLCAPTRSMILSGNDNHVAGMGSMLPVKGTNRDKQPGYEFHLTDRIVTVAQLLKDAGYHTYMSGKWHLGSEDENIPYAKGFERSFALMAGGATHFSNKAIFEGRPTVYKLDNQTVPFPEGHFSTDVYTEKMEEFIGSAKDGAPFFAYLPYTAPHWPLQLPDDWRAKYKGKFDIGYDSLRVLRFQSQKKQGIIAANATLPPRWENIKPWNQLTREEKKVEARKMELYAAMVDNLDEHIGKVIQFLKDSKQLDNTLIVFMSDNGASAEDFFNHKGMGPFLQKNYDNSYENMGKATSFVSYGPQWAEASAAPFKLFKQWATEGGTVTPMIVYGKWVKRKPGIENAFVNVTDLAPTFLQLAGVRYPQTYKNKKVYPLAGESILPFIEGKKAAVHDSNYVYGIEHYGACMIIKGKWKITNTSDPFDESAFALYDLSKDRGESTDLSKVYPNKYKELLEEWQKFKKKNLVIPLEKGEADYLDIIKSKAPK